MKCIYHGKLTGKFINLLNFIVCTYHFKKLFDIHFSFFFLDISSYLFYPKMIFKTIYRFYNWENLESVISFKSTICEFHVRSFLYSLKIFNLCTSLNKQVTNLPRFHRVWSSTSIIQYYLKPQHFLPLFNIAELKSLIQHENQLENKLTHAITLSNTTELERCWFYYSPFGFPTFTLF